jgi:RHS repeat-associated protein
MIKHKVMNASHHIKYYIFCYLFLFPVLLYTQSIRDTSQKNRPLFYNQTYALTDTNFKTNYVLVSSGDTIKLIGSGSGGKDVVGGNYTQHMDWTMDVSFTFLASNPVPNGIYTSYTLSIITGSIDHKGTATDIFLGNYTTYNFNTEHLYSNIATTGSILINTSNQTIYSLTSTLPYTAGQDHFNPDNIQFSSPRTVPVHVLNFDIWEFDETYLCYTKSTPLFDNSKNGKDCNNVQINCSGGTGSPVLSCNPITMNVVANDLPLWFKGGIGPDLKIDLVYNSTDDQNDITSAITYYPVGKGWSFNYGSFYVKQGNNVLIIMPDGRKDLYTFISTGVYKPPKGVSNKLEVSGSGYCITLQGSKEKYYYTSSLHNKITSMVDKGGQTVTLYYDGNNNLDYIKDANNRVFQINLNASGLITSVSDPLNRTAAFQYDSQGFLTGITDMGSYMSLLNYTSLPIAYASDGTVINKTVLTSVITPIGETRISYEFLTPAGSTSVNKKISFSNEQTTKSFTWIPVSLNQGINRYTDANGSNYDYYINTDSSRLEKMVPPISASTTFYGYDAYGNRNLTTVGSYVTSLVFDANGNITKITDPRGKISNLTYYTNNNLNTVTDPMGRLTTYIYDAANNLTGITTPTGSTAFTYNAYNLLATSKNPNNFTTTYSYNASGYLTGIQPPSGTAVTMINDNPGRVTSMTSRGVTTTYQYDNLDQVTKISYPDGTSVDKTYDFKNLVSEKDRGGRTSSYEYECSSSCQLRNSNGPQGTINYIRDGNGNIKTLSVNGQATSYEYDAMDRLLKQINPDGTYKQYTYDAIGNKLTRRDENGDVTIYSYDYNLLTNINYPGSTPDVSFSYNNNGEVTSMIDGTGTTTYSYDNSGRLTGKDGPESDDNFSYGYDNDGNRLAMSVPGMAVTYSYDNLDRLTNVSGGTFGSAQYTYDLNSNLTGKVYSNGSSTSYSYDNQNRLISLNNKHQNGAIFSGFNYTYDNSSMITKIIDQDGNISNYDYDYAYQLTNEEVLTSKGKTLWHNQFAYDNMGNRLTLDKNGILDNYKYNGSNQLLSLTKTSINASGIIDGDTLSSVYVEDIKARTKKIGNNKIEFSVKNIPLPFTSDSIIVAAKVNETYSHIGDSAKFIASSASYPDHDIDIRFQIDMTGVNPNAKNTIYRTRDTITYTYDANGNLTHRILSGQITTYSWDAENRLIQITYPNGSNEKYIYDGFGQRVKVLKNDILQQRYIYDNIFEAVAIKFSSGNQQFITRGLNLGGGIGGLISIHDNNLGNVFYLYNHRGDIINLLNTNDSINFSSDYNAFGEMSNVYGNNTSNFLFCSKEFNIESGNSNFGYRDYNSEMIRWISKDPIEFLNGEYNMYITNLNNPINNIDFNGLAVYLRRGNATGNAANDKIHRKICVDTYDKCGKKIGERCFSYGVIMFTLWGREIPTFIGQIYEDLTVGTNLDILNTNQNQDAEILNTLVFMVENKYKGIYNFGSNCITWSNFTFNDLKKAYCPTKCCK